MLNEKKGTCCHKCGHVHVKGTSCPTPFLKGERSCARRTNEVDALDNKNEGLWANINAKKARGEKSSPKGSEAYKKAVAAGNKLDEALAGLWANIRAKRARGEKPSRKGSEAYKKAVAAGKEINAMDETDQYCPSCLKEYLLEYKDKIEEAEYRGRKVQLGKPFYTPSGPKKRSVYVKNAKGNVVKVNFGDPNMKIKKSIPARRKSYRARHHCQSPGPRWKANYWSCRAW